METEQDFEKTAMRVSTVSIVANFGLTVFKLLAGVIAHSGAMISDAIHSASDVFSTIVGIIGIRISRKAWIKIIPTDMSDWNVWRRLCSPPFSLSPVWG